MVFISVEGNIGSGKSTILKHLKYTVLDEPVKIWQAVGPNKINVLDAFYSDLDKYAFMFQILAIESRLRLMEGIENKHVLTERSWESDKEIFCKMLIKAGHIDAVGEAIYNYIVEGWNPTKIDGCIYIKTNVDVCLERLKKRGRGEEAGITREYLLDLEKQTEEYLATKKRVLVIENDGDLTEVKIKSIIDRIGKFLAVFE